MTISNAEWEIMRVVWAQQKTTSNEIKDSKFLYIFHLIITLSAVT